jgi:hypothetical protein
VHRSPGLVSVPKGKNRKMISGRIAGKTISVMPSKSETSSHGPAIQSLSLAAEVILPKDPSLAIAASPKDLSLNTQGLVPIVEGHRQSIVCGERRENLVF